MTGTIIMPSGFVKDISNVGHYAVGDLRTTIMSGDDVERAIDLIKDVWNNKTN